MGENTIPINYPYDPRYNAKIYIPKLTEEERRARDTPEFKNVGH